MARAFPCLVLGGLVFVAAGAARADVFRFRWQPGQILNYKVEQQTTAAEVVDGKKTETTTKLANVKRWQVTDVDAAGVATLQLSLTALRVETTTPSGESVVFDSATPATGNPQMREQLGKYVGPVLAVLRVDGRGRVIEVKECKHGPASRYESEPPFVLTLPEQDVRPGAAWERNYQMTLAPPQGTGEQFEAVQKYAYQGTENAKTMITLETALKAPPRGLQDQIALLQFQPQGTALFDARAGRLERAELGVERELKGHQGEGSSYLFKSRYSELYVGDR